MLRNVGKRFMLSAACASALLLGAVMPLTSFAHPAQTMWDKCEKKECHREHARVYGASQSGTLTLTTTTGAAPFPAAQTVVGPITVRDNGLGEVINFTGDVTWP